MARGKASQQQYTAAAATTSSSSSSSSSSSKTVSSSLDGVFNVGRLEDVLRDIASSMAENTRRIAQLERDSTQRVSTQAFAVFCEQMSDRLGMLDAKAERTDERLLVLETTGGPLADRHSRVLQTLEERQQQSVDKAALLAFKTELDDYVSACLQRFDADKANTSIVSALEASQHAVTRQLSAVQSLIACKIDRVEVPLLEAAGEKIESLCVFSDDATERMAATDVALTAHAEALASKQERAAAAAAAAKTATALQQKADLTEFNAHRAAFATTRRQAAAAAEQGDTAARLLREQMMLGELVAEMGDKLTATVRKCE
jgi:hypothetical protein